MGVFNVFVVQLVVQLLTNVNGDDLVSSLLSTATDIRCTAPFLSLYTIGYIQCQRACTRYSDCEVLRYSKSQLECYLYFGKDCWDYSGDADSNIYMRRNKIDESIGGNCLTTGCPSANSCVTLKNGATCFPDRALSQYADYGTTFVDIDGVYFGMYPLLKTYHDAQQFCESFHGRLAVMDTPRKLQIIAEEAKSRNNRCLFVGVSKDANGQWVWNNGVPALVSGLDQQPDAHCAVVFNGRLDDYGCNWPSYFVCELL